MENRSVAIAVANGDGIGPEIMAATLHILKEAGAEIDPIHVEIGEKVYLKGESTGITKETWEIIRREKAFLKAPITTPQGGGFKSLNVTVRTCLGLYANVRPCVAYSPFVATKHPGMDVVVVRENEEDLYMGIEYRQSQETFEALKIMTRPGCERIIRYAFDYALQYGRKKVTCFTKDNILKLSDGLFHKVFDEIAPLYPSIESEHWIVDIGAAKLADTPTAFDVIVLPNLYGDILSDVAAQIAGSVGLAGSANIGTSGAMFEAIHGSAPRRAGQDIANPSGLLLAAIQMLVYIGQPKTAALIHNAWLKTLEQGIHTYDIFDSSVSKAQVGTSGFAKAVIGNLGKLPDTLQKVCYEKKRPSPLQKIKIEPKAISPKHLEGVDIFIDSNLSLEELVRLLQEASSALSLELSFISNRGVKVWPERLPETICSDLWRCRFLRKKSEFRQSDLVELLKLIDQKDLSIGQINPLYRFGEEIGFSGGEKR